MEMPNVAHEIRDQRRRVTYTVMAYRRLEEWEVKKVVRAFLANTRKRAKAGTGITIMTVLH